VRVDGARVLVTGATGGLGQAIVRGLHAAGVGGLVLTGRRADVLDPLASEVGGRAVACDLSDPAALDRLLDRAGDIDVLVANAALPASGRIDALSVAEVDAALAVNLRAPIVLGQAVATRLAARGAPGQLVFVSSLAGKAASAGGSLYSATKFGLRGFALGLREDLRADGIGVSLVSPGFIRDAGMFHASGAKLPPGIGTRSPEDVARAVVRAIEHDLPEVDVAPVPLRLGAAFASIAPGTASALQRRLGSDGISNAIDAGHRAPRG